MRPFIFLSLIYLVVLGCGKEVPTPTQLNIPKLPETRWKVPLSNGEETGSINPVLYKNLVIYTANDNGDINKSKLIALDKETGQRIWEWKNSNQAAGYITLSNTYLHDNVLVLPILGNPYQIVGINLDNGQLIWHTILPEAGSWQIAGMDHFVFHIRGNLDRMKDEIFVADVSTGHWQSVYAASNINAPVFINGMFAYKANDNKKYLTFLVGKYKDFSFSEGISTIFKYNIDSSIMVYQKVLTFLSKTSQPFIEAVTSDKLWLRGDSIIALAETVGEKVLAIPVPVRVSTSTGHIGIADKKLLMTTTDKLVCFNATNGAYLWQESGNTSGSPSRILYYDNVIYYTSGGDGKFHALNATTGETIYDVKSPDKKANGQGGFDSAITLDTVNRRIYTASYFSAICYKMP
jgi:outer membrane protein assembly factor BamB